MELLDIICVREMLPYCPPSLQDMLIECDIVTLDDVVACRHCGVYVGLWQGYCEECFYHQSCKECGRIRPATMPRFTQIVGVQKEMERICETCIKHPIPHFTCFFCLHSFYALDGHRISIQCDQSYFEHVICQFCIKEVRTTNRLYDQWVSCRILPTSYGAVLWYGPPLEIPPGIPTYHLPDGIGLYRIVLEKYRRWYRTNKLQYVSM